MIRRFFSSIVKPSIIITDNAWTKIRNILSSSENHYGFLFYASSGGCNGFNFNLDLLNKEKINEIENSKLKYNQIFDIENNKVYIDPYSEMFLIGTKIDYIKEDYSKNIFESKFVFIPDKSKASSCGCGTSFNIK